jgi:hypothetical protein
MPASSPSTHIVLRAAAALAVGVLLLPLTLAGCATEPVACNKTDGCVCDENVADCALACTGKGCEFTCPKNKSCSFECPEGGCKATGDSKNAFDLSCAGTGCSVVCDELVYTAGPDTEEISCDFGCDCR